MESEEKKAHLLLESIIFHYHGLDDEEKKILNETAVSLGGEEELAWTYKFISEDYATAFERSRVFLNNTIGQMPKEKRLYYLDIVWKANNIKGYISEMEAIAMLKFAREWQIENELMALVRGK
ncbi:MAG: hypothetical protein M3512_09315 [Bacteroidota bacterium]|nr:hypothetical protein [Bacteroidota bacterium]